MTEADLTRFIAAQDPVLSAVEAELAAGRKQTHWMWFIFPQLAGLGHSAMAMRYAIPDIGTARRYLADPVLGARLRRHVALMLRHRGKSALSILGTPDDMKFRSSMTLFEAAASATGDDQPFADALDAFYGGEGDPRTRAML